MIQYDAPLEQIVVAPLDYISVSGFKSIASIDKLRLRPVNLLIGANGSGKSNFIEVFSFLHEIREKRLEVYVAKSRGADKILHFGSKTTQSINIHISFEEEVNQYSIKLEATADDQLIPTEENVYFWKPLVFPSPYKEVLPPKGKEAGISDHSISNISVAKWVRRGLESWRLYHFHDTSSSSPMRKTSDLNNNHYFYPDGSNLAAFLFYLKEKEMGAYQLIRNVVQRVTPFFEDFNLKPSLLNTDTIRLEWQHKNSDKYFDVSSLSDGTLRFIALATLFLQPRSRRPSVILVDEPELGLHPYAIAILASMIKMASKEMQVIVSTQSSILLDHFEPEDVLVTSLKDGGTHLDRLDSIALQSWLNEYSLGQLWEKNEIGGRPA